MPAVSMVAAGAAPTPSAARRTKRSRSGPSRPMIRPGLVQSWPALPVSEATKPRAMSSARAARAPGSRNTGLVLLISA